MCKIKKDERKKRKKGVWLVAFFFFPLFLFCFVFLIEFEWGFCPNLVVLNQYNNTK